MQLTTLRFRRRFATSGSRSPSEPVQALDRFSEPGVGSPVGASGLALPCAWTGAELSDRPWRRSDMDARGDGSRLWCCSGCSDMGEAIEVTGDVHGKDTQASDARGGQPARCERAEAEKPERAPSESSASAVTRTMLLCLGCIGNTHDALYFLLCAPWPSARAQ